jgi:hypothetical protein
MRVVFLLFAILIVVNQCIAYGYADESHIHSSPEDIDTTETSNDISSFEGTKWTCNGATGSATGPNIATKLKCNSDGVCENVLSSNQVTSKDCVCFGDHDCRIDGTSTDCVCVNPDTCVQSPIYECDVDTGIAHPVSIVGVGVRSGLDCRLSGSRGHLESQKCNCCSGTCNLPNCHCNGDLQHEKGCHKKTVDDEAEQLQDDPKDSFGWLKSTYNTYYYDYEVDHYLNQMRLRWDSAYDYFNNLYKKWAVRGRSSSDHTSHDSTHDHTSHDSTHDHTSHDSTHDHTSHDSTHDHTSHDNTHDHTSHDSTHDHTSK